MFCLEDARVQITCHSRWVAFLLCAWAILDSNISLEAPSSDHVLALFLSPTSQLQG